MKIRRPGNWSESGFAVRITPAFRLKYDDDVQSSTKAQDNEGIPNVVTGKTSERAGKIK